ncbi:shTK domain protein [Oesophagostomum dentatum]|uniref:ShTK domain protein n=1 Tax=Oesophagostomum dentatum TaxID=61180 RepID=A0A0B1TAK7_OESDE|nr:shTK domain protein [Oesophagostomum dentatum]
MNTVLLVASLVVAAYAAITDKNCTTADGKWSERALGCENSVSDAVCSSIISAQTPLTVGTDTDRATNCYQMNSADSEEKKQAMVNMCPKTCGYCCMTPEYSCANKELSSVPGVTCATLTQAQCKDPKWREIIARDCPNVCGFCLEGGCIDAAIECANDKSICRNVDMQTFVKDNCKKTCGYCDGSSTRISTQYPGGYTSYTNSPGTCVDNAKRQAKQKFTLSELLLDSITGFVTVCFSCASWKTNGFCQSNFYNDAQKRENCAKTCGYC